MSAGLIGRKVGMTRIFDDSGAAVSVTVIEAGPCPVVQVKTAATDNYSATADVRRRYFRPPLPAATGVIVAGLLRPGALIEIEAYARLRD